MPSLTIDLNPKGAVHKLILEKCRDRINYSKKQYNSRREKWQKNEDAIVAYMPERDVDALRRLEREQGGKPQFTTVVLPYTYGVLMSSHTYWTTVFMSRSPIMQFAGRHGEGEMQVQAMEALIDYQMQVGQALVPLYIWLLDVGKYGAGILGEYWCAENSIVSEIVEEEQKIAGVIPTGKMLKKKISRSVPGYVGNKLFNVRPFDFYPDPRVPLHKFQEGEFCGRYFELGWNEILNRKALGYYTNIEELKTRSAGGACADGGKESGSPRLEVPNADDIFGREIHQINASVLFKGFELAIELIPSEWGLGNGMQPEKWVFTFTSDFTLCIGAQPMGAYHNKFPYNVLELEPEGYGLVNRGLPEILEPIQRTVDWLINAHFYNVRKTVNNQFLVDPSRVVMKDLLDPMAGGLIRAKPAAYGSDMRLSISQLQTTDITRMNISDIGQMMEFGSRATGVNDQIMGMLVGQGGRKSATEIRTSSTFGTNRLKTEAEYFSAMGWGPLAQKLVQNSQQYYDMERKFKVVGDLAQQAGEKFMNITPADIQGFYDFTPVDGTLPVDRFAQANLWREMLGQLRNFPEIMQQYDIGKIFAWVAQLGGLKNIQQFKVQIQGPGQIAAQVQQGNLVPMPQRTGPAGIPTGPVSNVGAAA